MLSNPTGCRVALQGNIERWEERERGGDTLSGYKERREVISVIIIAVANQISRREILQVQELLELLEK